MPDFSAANLLDLAKARYGEATLRARIRGSRGALSSVQPTAPGSGYGSATVAFTPVNGGAGAAATAVIVGGEVVSYTLTDPGAGYLEPPTVVISGDSTGAEAIAVLLSDTELLRIAYSVISRAQSALQKSGRWPIPGTWPTGSTNPAGNDISGEPFSEIWPFNLLENALELFNWRTLSGLDQVSAQQQRVGKDAGSFFDAVDSGDMPIGIGGDADVGPPEALSARTRDGSSNLANVPGRQNILDSLAGGWWDFS